VLPGPQPCGERRLLRYCRSLWRCCLGLSFGVLEVVQVSCNDAVARKQRVWQV
jgi:hypothetical protein